MRQWIDAIVAEAGGVGDGAEQPMDGAGLGPGELLGEGRRALERQRRETRCRRGDGLAHASGGLAGGRGQGDAQRFLGGCVVEQRHEERGDGVGLAGSRTTDDDGEGPGESAVDGAALLGREGEIVQQLRETLGIGRDGNEHGLFDPGGDVGGDLRLEHAIALEIEEIAAQDQGSVGGREPCCCFDGDER